MVTRSSLQAEAVRNSLFFIFLRKLAFLVRTVQKCLHLIAGNDALSLHFSADFPEQLRMSRFSAGRRWKNARKFKGGTLSFTSQELAP